MRSIAAEAAVCLWAKPKRLGFFSAGGAGGESGSVVCSAGVEVAKGIAGFAGAIRLFASAVIATEDVDVACGLDVARFFAGDFLGA
jgi:hypothetical protein